jgi:hypothetical protein
VLLQPGMLRGPMFEGTSTLPLPLGVVARPGKPLRLLARSGRSS